MLQITLPSIGRAGPLFSMGRKFWWMKASFPKSVGFSMDGMKYYRDRAYTEQVVKYFPKKEAGRD